MDFNTYIVVYVRPANRIQVIVSQLTLAYADTLNPALRNALMLSVPNHSALNAVRLSRFVSRTNFYSVSNENPSSLANLGWTSYLSPTQSIGVI